MITQRSSGSADIQLAVRVIDAQNKMYFGVRGTNDEVGFYVDPGEDVPSGIKREAKILLDSIYNNEEKDAEFPFDKDSEKRRLKQLEINQAFLLDAIMKIHSNLCPKQFGTWQMKVEQAVNASKEIKGKE